jgi:hypothetical protein
MELDQHKRPGFRIKDYFISIPIHEDFLFENDDGTMKMSIDIFKIDGNNNMIAVDQEKMDQEEFSDLQIHIEAWINEALTRAIEEAEKEQGTKNK